MLLSVSRPAEDEKGLDEKVLAVPDKDPRFNHMTSLRDVPEHVLREITNFFEVLLSTKKGLVYARNGSRLTRRFRFPHHKPENSLLLYLVCGRVTEEQRGNNETSIVTPKAKKDKYV